MCGHPDVTTLGVDAGAKSDTTMTGAKGVLRHAFDLEEACFQMLTYFGEPEGSTPIQGNQVAPHWCPLIGGKDSMTSTKVKNAQKLNQSLTIM